MGAKLVEKLGLSEDDIMNIITNHPMRTRAEIGRIAWDVYDLKNSGYMYTTVMVYISEAINSLRDKDKICSEVRANRCVWVVKSQPESIKSFIKGLLKKWLI